MQYECMMPPAARQGHVYCMSVFMTVLLRVWCSWLQWLCRCQLARWPEWRLTHWLYSMWDDSLSARRRCFCWALLFNPRSVQPQLDMIDMGVVPVSVAAGDRCQTCTRGGAAVRRPWWFALIRAGLDVGAPDARGQTPAGLACWGTTLCYVRTEELVSRRLLQPLA